MNKLRIGTLLLGFFCQAQLPAQTPEQWARTVNWDGYSHWSKYIRYAPGFMGPNALPVPAITTGEVDNKNYVSAATQLHFSKGDNTQSVVLYGNYSLVKDVISFDVSYIPVEYYRMSDTVKRERHVYWKYYNDKKARGDFFLNANIRLLKKWDKKIKLALRIGYRYPSSNGFGAARFTDNMGYYFDISAGKPLGSSPWKWIGMAGFYCWQIEKGDLRQNDAFLFGTGLEWNQNGWKLQPNIAGYLGYFKKSGDKPVLFRLNSEKKFGRSSVLLRFQQGLHDFKYSTAELGIKYFFK